MATAVAGPQLLGSLLLILDAAPGSLASMTQRALHLSAVLPFKGDGARPRSCGEGGNNATFGCFGHGRGTHLWVKRGCRGIFRCNGNSVSCGTVGPRVSNRQSCACGDNPQGVR